MLKQRILICGGRNYADYQEAYKVLNEAKKHFAERFIIIEGGARGGDRVGREWAKAQGCPVLTVEANWDFYKKGAGPTRNSWMIEFCYPDLVIALPGGAGTSNMIKQALAAQIDVYNTTGRLG